MKIEICTMTEQGITVTSSDSDGVITGYCSNLGYDEALMTVAALLVKDVANSKPGWLPAYMGTPVGEIQHEIKYRGLLETFGTAPVGLCHVSEIGVWESTASGASKPDADGMKRPLLQEN